MTIRQIRDMWFKGLNILEMEDLLWHCTPFPFVSEEVVMEHLEEIAGVYAAGEPFDEIMYLFGPE